MPVDEIADETPGEPLSAPAPAQPPSGAAPAPATGRQFYPVTDLAELARLLDHPLDQWLAFLHPDQRRLVERRFAGPAKVTGSAGTGKTVLALHRARALARRGRRVLLTSYTNALCDALERQLALLCDAGERGRIRVLTVHRAAGALARAAGIRVTLLGDEEARRAVAAACRPGLPLTAPALAGEWQAVLAPQGIDSWDGYRAASRAGRGRPLSVAQRKQVWDALAPVLERWRREGRADYATLCLRVREAVERDRALVARAFPGGIDAVLVDEVQDLGPPELRLLAALAGEGEDRLFLTGDGGQRIYGRRLSLAACGIPVRGRAFVLRVNYRTTAQIRRFADRMLPASGDDLDGGQERRRAVRSILSGAPPELLGCATAVAEFEAITREIGAWIAAGYAPEEIAVFARTNLRADELRRTLRERGLPAKNLDPASRAATDTRGVTVTTLHRAKGMEYKAVVVAGASRDVLPLPAVVNEAGDPADREDALAREAQLLYVGLTRARDRLLVTWTGEPSVYLEEALTAPGAAAGSGTPA
jgi:superfamily I DNA/RNA helicase